MGSSSEILPSGVNRNYLRIIAAILFLLNGIVHLAYIPVYDELGYYPGIVAAVYFVTCFLLFRHVQLGTWMGFIVGVVGAAIEVPEFFFIQANPLAFMHVAFNLAAAILCGYLLASHYYK